MANQKQIEQAWREIDSDIEREGRSDSERLDFLARELAKVNFSIEHHWNVELPRYCEGDSQANFIRHGETLRAAIDAAMDSWPQLKKHG